jgi:type III pantothenate kinase
VLLTIDVGNTQTHVGAFDGQELVEHWRFSTDRQSTGDELAVVIHDLLALRSIEFAQIHGEAVSSVVPRLVSEYQYMFERYLDREALILGPGTKTGMPILLENPHELGPDRLANAVAGYDQHGGPCVIVDFGTAINYDVVSAAGEYLGGIISPGIEISIEALTSRAARLTKVDIREPRALIGKSTDAAVQSGIVYGFASQVDGICGLLRKEIGDEITTIATGGLAHVIVGFTQSIDVVDAQGPAPYIRAKSLKESAFRARNPAEAALPEDPGSTAKRRYTCASPSGSRPLRAA